MKRKRISKRLLAWFLSVVISLTGFSGVVPAAAAEEMNRAASEADTMKEWTIVNQDEDLTIQNATKVTIQTRIGDFAKGYNEPKNYWLMDAPEGDFTLTMKVSGGLNAHAQKIGLMAFADKQTIASVARRYHSNGGGSGAGNYFGMFQNLNGSWGENFYKDTNVKADAWLKLERKGNIFNGWYSYNGVDWISVGYLNNKTVGEKADMKIGFYAVNGSKNDSVSATIENFTCNGAIIPFSHEWAVGDGWTLNKPDGSCVLNSANSISMPTSLGDFAANKVEPSNYWLMDAPTDDFSLTVKVSGGLSAHPQTVGLMAFHNKTTIASVCRRYHTGYGSTGSANVFSTFQHYGGSWYEKGVADANPANAAWLKLEKSGNVLKGYYSYDGMEWASAGADLTNAAIGSSSDLKIGVYATRGTGKTAASVTVEEFTCDGILYPFAKKMPFVNVSGMQLNQERLELASGDTVTLAASVLPENAGCKSILWSSQDEKVATVSNGAVTGVGVGETVITATSADGGYTASCVVTVTGDTYEEASYTIASPDGTLKTVLYTNAAGEVSYKVLKEDVYVVEASKLGIVTNVGDFTSGLMLAGASEIKEVADSYDLTGAKVTQVEAVGNEMTVNFKKNGIDFAVVVRMYDDGAAFRYLVNGEGDLQISSEATTLQIPADAAVYAMSYAADNQSQEKKYAPSQLTGTYCEPMLYETADGTWALISEAALTGNYCGTYLAGNGTGSVNFHFSKEQKGNVVTTMPFASPWRFVVIGTAADVNLNTMAETLSPQADGDYSWVEPGVTAWTWLNGDSTRSYDTYKAYIDACAELGWPYLLMDDGWQPAAGQYYDWFDELSAYAKEKGVKLLVWAESWDLDDAATRRKVFAEWVEMGISGAKIDHFLSSSQSTMQLQQEMLKDAAEFKLVVNFHGSAKPAGERRTYPNLLTSEGVYGHEMSTSKLNAFNNCMIPFTRNAVGTVDYTPLFSHNRKNVSFSLAQMAAMAVVYESGIPCLADKPASYMNSSAVLYFEDMPASWEESIVLEAIPGELVVIARRSGDEWYVGGMCNSAHTQELDLSFLGEGNYYAVLSKDGAGLQELVTEKLVVTAENHLTIPMIASGGFTLRLMSEDPSADVIQLNQTEVTVREYESAALKASVWKGETEIGGSVSWSSSDESIAIVENGVVTGVGIGEAVIEASITGFAGEKISAQCKVTVLEGDFAPADGWVVVNRDKDLTINSATSISIDTRIGDLASGYNDPANYWLMDAPEGDFTLTIKVSGGLYAHAQKIGLMAFHNNTTVASVARRYHDSKGGNRFGMFQRYNTSWGETFFEDTNIQADAWLKLERTGNTFKGWYSYDQENWISVGSLENDLVGTSENMKIGVYAINGSKHDSVKATIEDFTLNGVLIPFAKFTETGKEHHYVKIVTQPVSVTVEAGEAAAAAVEAAGDGLTYTWYYKNPGNKKFYVSGDQFVVGDGSAYSIPMEAWRDGQEVYCVVSDLYGNSVQSNTVVLNMVKPDIEIIKQPEDVMAANGEDAVVTVEAAGEDLTYTWYYKNSGNVKFYVSGEQFVSEDGCTYSIPMSVWRDGQQVYCVITNASGDSVQTKTVTLTMEK